MDVTSGRVLVDGVDVRDQHLAALRAQIATVLQDTMLLDGTLRDNIVCGAEDVRDRHLRPSYSGRERCGELSV